MAPAAFRSKRRSLRLSVSGCAFSDCNFLGFREGFVDDKGRIPMLWRPLCSMSSLELVAFENIISKTYRLSFPAQGYPGTTRRKKGQVLSMLMCKQGQMRLNLRFFENCGGRVFCLGTSLSTGFLIEFFQQSCKLKK